MVNGTIIDQQHHHEDHDEEEEEDLEAAIARKNLEYETATSKESTSTDVTVLNREPSKAAETKSTRRVEVLVDLAPPSPSTVRGHHHHHHARHHIRRNQRTGARGDKQSAKNLHNNSNSNNNNDNISRRSNFTDTTQTPSFHSRSSHKTTESHTSERRRAFDDIMATKRLLHPPGVGHATVPGVVAVKTSATKKNLKGEKRKKANNRQGATNDDTSNNKMNIDHRTSTHSHSTANRPRGRRRRQFEESMKAKRFAHDPGLALNYDQTHSSGISSLASHDFDSNLDEDNDHSRPTVGSSSTSLSSSVASRERLLRAPSAFSVAKQRIAAEAAAAGVDGNEKPGAYKVAGIDALDNTEENEQEIIHWDAEIPSFHDDDIENASINNESSLSLSLNAATAGVAPSNIRSSQHSTAETLMSINEDFGPDVSESTAGRDSSRPAISTGSRNSTSSGNNNNNEGHRSNSIGTSLHQEEVLDASVHEKEEEDEKEPMRQAMCTIPPKLLVIIVLVLIGAVIGVVVGVVYSQQQQRQQQQQTNIDSEGDGGTFPNTTTPTTTPTVAPLPPCNVTEILSACRDKNQTATTTIPLPECAREKYQSFIEDARLNGLELKSDDILQGGNESSSIFPCTLVNQAMLALAATSATEEEDDGPLSFSLQRLALGVIYFTAGGMEWHLQDGWIFSESPECEWHGVQCNDDGEVVRLVLEANNLRGSIPSEIGLLTNLADLDLHNNNLKGPIPLKFFNLQNTISGLNINTNPLGPYPFPRLLLEFSKLDLLDMSDTGLTGTLPSDISNLTALENLIINGNALSGTIPTELGSGLSNIEIFSVVSNNLAGPIPSELGNLTTLQLLLLSDNELTGSLPSEFGQLTNLNKLIFNRNSLSGVIPLQVCSLWQESDGTGFQLTELGLTGASRATCQRGGPFGGLTCPSSDCCRNCPRCAPGRSIDC